MPRWMLSPLFLLNVVGSGITVALLFLRRVFAYCVGALAISVTATRWPPAATRAAWGPA